MKKMLAMFLAVVFALPLSGFAAAADNAAKPAKAAKTETKVEKKVRSLRFTGTVEAVDAAAGTLTVKGKKGNVDLKAGEKVNLAGLKTGEKVIVKRAGDTALAVKVLKAKKAGKKAGKEPAEKK